MTTEKTPCEKMGYKVGDKFEIVEDYFDHFEVGQIVELFDDDGSELPLFADADHDKKACIPLQGVKKIEVSNQPKTKHLKQLIEKRNKKASKMQKLKMKIDSLNAQIEQLLSEIEQDVSESTGMDCKLTDKDQYADNSIPYGVDIHNPSTWKKGDIIECVGGYSVSVTIGKEYVFNDFYPMDSKVEVLEDDDGDEWTTKAKFQFVRRPK